MRGFFMFLLLTCSCTFQHYQRQLSEEDLPSGLYEKRHQLASLTLDWPVTDLSWLRDARSLTSLSVVSSNLRRVGPMPKTLTDLRLENTGLVEIHGLPALKKLEILGNRHAVDLSELDGHALEELVVDSVQSLDGGLPDLPKLKKLVIRNTAVNFDLSLNRFRYLKELHLGFLKPPENQIEGILQVDSLERLILEGGWLPRSMPRIKHLHVENSDLKHLFLPNSIEVLDLRRCQGLSRLNWVKLSELKTLRLTGYMGIDNVSSILDRLPKLEHLHLMAVPFGWLAQLEGRALIGLELSDLSEPVSSPDNPLDVLTKLPLKHLSIKLPYQRSADFSVLSSLTDLLDLTLRSSSILELNLAWFPHLEKLVLDGLPIESLDGISICKTLRELSILHCENLIIDTKELSSLKHFTWEGMGCLGLDLCSGYGVMTWVAGTCGTITPPCLSRLSLFVNPASGYGILPVFKTDSLLQDLGRLKSISLNRMQVASLSFLNRMDQLKEVRLDKVKVSSLKELPRQVDSLYLSKYVVRGVN